MSKVIIVNVSQSIKLYLLCRYTLMVTQRLQSDLHQQNEVLLLLQSLQLVCFTLMPPSRSCWGLTGVAALLLVPSVAAAASRGPEWGPPRRPRWAAAPGRQESREVSKEAEPEQQNRPSDVVEHQGLIAAFNPQNGGLPFLVARGSNPHAPQPFWTRSTKWTRIKSYRGITAPPSDASLGFSIFERF